MRYNLGDKVWKRNPVLSSTLRSVAANLAPPKFASRYTTAAQLGTNVYEVVNQDGKSVGKVHVEDLKPFHGSTASEENSGGEQAEASPSEISEYRNASSTSHSANAEALEAEAHPCKRSRPRNARLVVKRTARLLGRRVNKRTLVADGADKRPTQQSTSAAASPLPRPRGRPAGSKNGSATTHMTAEQATPEKMPRPIHPFLRPLAQPTPPLDDAADHSRHS